MNEGEVDHPIRRGRAGLQTVEVVESAALHRCPGGSDGSGRGIRASESDDLMTCIDEFGNDGGTDPAGRSSDKNAHENTSR